MRFNEKELISLAELAADKEGHLTVKVTGFREFPKERWFKLRGNLLYYYRINEHGAVYEKEPAGLYVLENCRIQAEPYFDTSYSFSLDDGDKKHYFSASSHARCESWIECLKNASYEQKRMRLSALEQEIKRLKSTIYS